MAVRTLQLAAGTAAGDSAYHDVYTCPAGKTTIVKEWSISQAGAGTAIVQLRLDPTAGAAVFPLNNLAAPQYVPIVEQRWLVLEPGDVLAVWSNSGGTIFYVISGTELDGVAP